MPPKRTNGKGDKVNPSDSKDDSEDRPVSTTRDSDNDSAEDSADEASRISGAEESSKISGEAIQPTEETSDVDPKLKSQVSGQSASTASSTEHSHSPLFPDGRSLINFIVDLNVPLLWTQPSAISTSVSEMEAKHSKSEGSKSSDSESVGSKSPQPEGSDSKNEGSTESERSKSPESKSEESKSPELDSERLKSLDNEGSDSKNEGSKSSDNEGSDSKNEGSKSSDNEGSDSKSELSKSPELESERSKSLDNEGSDSKSEVSKSPEHEGSDGKSKGETAAENEVPDSKSEEPKSAECADSKKEGSKSPDEPAGNSDRSTSPEYEFDYPVVEEVAAVPPAQVNPDEHRAALADRVSNLLVQRRSCRRRDYQRGPGPRVLPVPMERRFDLSDDDDSDDPENMEARRVLPIPQMPVEPPDFGERDPYFLIRTDGTIASEDDDEDGDLEDGSEQIDDALMPYDAGFLPYCRVPVAGPGNQGVLVPYVHPGRRRIFVHLEGPLTLRHYAFLSINVEMCNVYERMNRLVNLWASRTVDIDGGFRPALDRLTAAFIDMKDRGDPKVPDAALRMSQLGHSFTDCEMVVQRNRDILEYVRSYSGWIRDMYDKYIFPNTVIEADNNFPETFEELLEYLRRAQSNLTILPDYVRIFNVIRHIVEQMLFEEQEG